MKPELYTVRLTAEQITILRRLISEKVITIRLYPLPKDEGMAEKLYELDKPLHSISQLF